MPTLSQAEPTISTGLPVRLTAYRNFFPLWAWDPFDWLDGHFIGASDEEILKEAARQSMTLLSFDLKTIPPLLRTWGERGVDHGGVIFVDNKNFCPE